MGCAVHWRGHQCLGVYHQCIRGSTLPTRFKSSPTQFVEKQFYKSREIIKAKPKFSSLVRFLRDALSTKYCRLESTWGLKIVLGLPRRLWQRNGKSEKVIEVLKRERGWGAGRLVLKAKTTKISRFGTDFQLKSSFSEKLPWRPIQKLIFVGCCVQGNKNIRHQR